MGSTSVVGKGKGSGGVCGSRVYEDGDKVLMGHGLRGSRCKVSGLEF
jgi:hypothetical protein